MVNKIRGTNKQNKRGLHGKNSDGVPWKIIDSTPAPEVQMKIKIPFGSDTTDFIFSLSIIILIFEYFFPEVCNTCFV